MLASFTALQLDGLPAYQLAGLIAFGGVLNDEY
jgi:hypothetical protein